jgi:hypothetical protein
VQILLKKHNILWIVLYYIIQIFRCLRNALESLQPRSQALPYLVGKTLAIAGHVAPRFWVLNWNWVVEEWACLYLENYNLCAIVSGDKI